MMTIWKYEVPIQDSFKIELPKDAKILCCESGFMWALVNTEAKKEIRRFRVYRTGQEIERLKSQANADNFMSLQYVATIFFPPYVWHLFEER